MENPWPIRLVKNARKVSWLQHSIASHILADLSALSQIVPHMKPITTWLQYKGLIFPSQQHLPDLQIGHCVAQRGQPTPETILSEHTV